MAMVKDLIGCQETLFTKLLRKKYEDDEKINFFACGLKFYIFAVCITKKTSNY
ncbi:hypothetical protein [Marinomonas atlantica]|uniref:hypothetical protein n=1 Tax=Marinomonas atlantica TaxID=1806668 RepID=UPI000AB57472|nr:hypothetical protein [Marinomonas atlantica]MCO4786068.1 hypothetical protein [Marinomonas atlantica]